MKKLGFIGLGAMGLPMSANLLKKGYSNIIGYDVFEKQKEKFAALGGETANSPEEIYTSCDIIFTCLPSNELVHDTISGVIEKAGGGTLVVDMGSTAPNIIQELYGRGKEKGISVLDSPVSGGETGAVAGTLVIMCGGDEEAYQQALEYLLCMGKTVTYMGASGYGSTAKLANNMMVGGHLVAMSEAFAFAAKAGIEPQVLFDAIKGGFAQSAVMDLKVPKIIERDFEPTARIFVHQKDMKNAVEAAGHMGVEIPMSQMVLEQMNRLEQEGLINEDQCAMVKYYEKAMNVIVGSEEETK